MIDFITFVLTPYKILALCYGLCIGSFLNVVIHRLPLGESIIFRSKCPKCGDKIPWYLNIPVVSYLLLLGRCRKCRALISWRYPFVELILGVAAFGLCPLKMDYHSLTYALFYFSIFAVLVAHFFIDLDHQILPDSLNLFLLAAILSFAIVNFPVSHWVWGVIVGLGLPLAVTWGFYLLRGQIGLGGGDIKLYAILGLYMGAKGAVELIFYSCFLGSLIGGGLILAKKMSKDRPIPFGPFIIIAAVVQIYFPQLYSILNFF